MGQAQIQRADLLTCAFGSTGEDMTNGHTVTLYCFAHAGAGTSSMRRWRPLLGPDVDLVPVLLPGRESRRREARVTDKDALLADVLPHFAHRPAGPYVLYGHSLGGLVAYTVARALQEAGQTTPALVAIGACAPPDAGSELVRAADRPDDELLRLIDGIGGLHKVAASAVEPGGLWRRAVLPVLRDDLRLARDLRAAALRESAGARLRMPLLTVTGSHDHVVGPDEAAGWRRWTTGRITTRTIAGDHFFVRGRELPALLARACRVVRRTPPRPGPVPARPDDRRPDRKPAAA
ncbi:thioesterase II family protein [Streptomyces sp. NPDC002446]